MAIFTGITEGAVEKILSLAAYEGISSADLYVQVDDKPVGPWRMFWIMTLTTAFNPDKYHLVEMGGLRFTVEKEAAYFLRGAVIDFDSELVSKPFYPMSGDDRPVMPKGFKFTGQNIPYPAIFRAN